jgi:N-acetylmuramic acid 6-phosphate etherase
VLLDTGPEVISGSTRLKAGTAQKIALNTISSALMVRLHKVYGNLMVDVQASNAKLRQRALMLTVHATGAASDEAGAALAACGGQVKPAIVMLKTGCDAERARALLATHHGSIRLALAAIATRR